MDIQNLTLGFLIFIICLIIYFILTSENFDTIPEVPIQYFYTRQNTILNTSDINTLKSKLKTLHNIQLTPPQIREILLIIKQLKMSELVDNSTPEMLLNKTVNIIVRSILNYNLGKIYNNIVL